MQEKKLRKSFHSVKNKTRFKNGRSGMPHFKHVVAVVIAVADAVVVVFAASLGWPEATLITRGVRERSFA